MVIKKIYLIVTTYFPTLVEPWRYSFTYDQAIAIKEESRYEVVVIKPDFEGEYDFQGIRVIGFKHKTRGAWLCPSLFFNRNIAKMIKTLKSAGIDIGNIAVVHGHLAAMAPYAMAFKRINKGIRTMLQFHDADPYGMLLGTGKFGWIKKIIYFNFFRKEIAKIDVLIAISKNVEKVVREAPHQTVLNSYEPMRKAMHGLRFFRKTKVNDIYVLHNGVNQNIFHRSLMTKDESSFVIGCVAVFRDLKDQITLLKACNEIKDKIPNLKVRLIGCHHSGDMFLKCKEYIKENNLNAEIIHSLNHKELPDFYRSIDLFVLPSFFEGFGCVFTEAWCCGTPFITCEGQGMDDLIYPEDRQYWLCKQQDYLDLAQKILEYYKNRKKQLLNGSVNINQMIRKFLDFYNLEVR